MKLFNDRLAIMLVPRWSLGAGRADYWGRRFWVKIGPVIFTA